MADNIFKKLASARMELQQAGLKKSGMNNFLRFAYFELSDFLPKINEMANRYGFFTRFAIDEARAELTVINTDDPKDYAVFYVNILDCLRSQRTFNDAVIDATRKTAEAHEYRDSKDLKPLNVQSIQDLGKNITYLRRYLLMIAFEICEVDALDASLGAPERTQRSAKKAEDKNTFKPADAPQKRQEARQAQNTPAPPAKEPTPAPDAPAKKTDLNTLNRELLKKAYNSARGAGYTQPELEDMIGQKLTAVNDANVNEVILKIERQLAMDSANF